MLSLNNIKMEKLPLSYISNDNGFMNEPPAFFNQRTLLTRFKTNNSERVSSQFVRKPVMVTMAMLSYLGPKELPIFLRRSENCSCDSKLSVLAGGDGTDVGPGWSAAVITSLGPGNATLCSNNKLDLCLRLPLDIELKYVVYQLDNEQTNPRRVWEEGGKPADPSVELLEEMRAHEGPVVTQTGSVLGGFLTLNIPIRSPSVTLVHLCTNPRKPPAKVLNLRGLNITFNEVLLLWQDSDTRCVKTYEVYFCQGECQMGDFRMISERLNIMLSYQFRAQSDSRFTEGSIGKYKVRVRDYWDQFSEFSDVLMYG